MRFARSRGLRRLTGIVLPENQKMLALANSLGFKAVYAVTQQLMRIDRDL